MMVSVVCMSARNSVYETPNYWTPETKNLIQITKNKFYFFVPTILIWFTQSYCLSRRFVVKWCWLNCVLLIFTTRTNPFKISVKDLALRCFPWGLYRCNFHVHNFLFVCNVYVFEERKFYFLNKLMWRRVFIKCNRVQYALITFRLSWQKLRKLFFQKIKMFSTKLKKSKKKIKFFYFNVSMV